MTDLFSQPPLNFSGKELKEIGMRMAETSAEERNPGWGERCYELLKEYLKINKEPFRTEFFRMWVANKIETPPSLRSFGSIMFRAAKEGLIKRLGASVVDNPKAHRCFATTWQAA